MKSNPDSKLEGIIRSSHQIEHHDKLDIIANHVIVIVFISLLFLASVFMFFTSEPNTENATAYAIVEYKNVIPDFKVFDKISSGLEDIRNSNDRPYLLLMMFVGWIMVAGFINIALHEKEIKKQEIERHKK
jgi:hypothetical protein